SIPTGRRFGDVTGNGAVDVVDASRVGNWAVGNPSPAGTPIPAPGDLAELVGNVAPFNSPGLGETADTKGPGWDANCVRLWDVLDASNISNEAVGTDRPVVGELVPADGFDAATGLPRRGTVCAPAGNARPALRTGIDPLPNPALTVTAPFDTTLVYVRNYFEVRFDDSLPGASIQAFLTVFRARIVGGSGTRIPEYSRYYILTADPGPSWGAMDSLYQRISSYPGVSLVMRSGAGTVRARGATGLPNGDLPPAIRTGLAISSPVPRVTDPSDPTKYQLRTYFEVGFQDTVSGSLVGSFLTTFRARIVGGSANGLPGWDRYYVLTADPGPTWAAYDSLYQAIARYPGVKFVLRNHGGYVFARGRFPLDTARPAIVNGSPRRTSPSLTVANPADPRWVFDRESFSVRFDDSTSGQTIREFLTRFRARIVGGSSRPDAHTLNRYHIVIADPGASWAVYDSVYQAMRAAPGVEFVLPAPTGTWVQVRDP
ncbi:MAG: hypothetical protein SF070_06135, partial [Gemmatimonadota bacterium]|nr:hypothetical protein [Gemmatimonadota bacterium]